MISTSFRRFRAAHLRKNRVPWDLQKLWLGHANKDVTDRYAEQLNLGGQFKSGQLGSDQNRPTEVARDCQKLYPITKSPSKVNRILFSSKL